jgi:hypothetical protein
MSKLYFGYKEDLPKGYKDFGTPEQAQKKGQLRRYGRFLYNEKQLDKIIDKEVDKEINKIIEQPKITKEEQLKKDYDFYTNKINNYEKDNKDKFIKKKEDIKKSNLSSNEKRKELKYLDEEYKANLSKLISNKNSTNFQLEDLEENQSLINNGLYEQPKIIKEEKPKIIKEEKSNRDNIIDANDKLIKIVDNILNIKSPYTFTKEKPKIENELNNISKSLGQKELIKNISTDIRESLSQGFYPTPVKCISIFKEDIERAENILEPTAGLGYILNYIRKVNKDAKLTAIEYYHPFIDILKKFNPDTTINPNDVYDFLDYFPEKNSYDLIVENPPFAHGDDSRFYLDFLFHSLYILNNSNVKYEKELIFISPNITKEVNKKEYIQLYDIINFCSKPKLKNILNRYKIYPKDSEFKHIYELNSDYEIVEKIINLFDFGQCNLIGVCNDFTSTKIKANMYRFLLH